jgi:hypothetical protein
MAHTLFPLLPFRSYTLKREYLRLEVDGDGLPFPCGTCRQILLRKAARVARRLRAELVITGEVVGRGGLGPAELALLDAQSGLSGRVLRPLSARLLPFTWAEEGHLKRDVFGNIAVGERGRLLRLVRDLRVTVGIEGRRCLLSEPRFAMRMAQLLSEGPPTVNTLGLLEFEHFYHIPPGLKVVVAVGQEECDRLQSLFLPTDVRLYLPIPHSPLALVRVDWSCLCPADRLQAVALAARITLTVAGLPRGIKPSEEPEAKSRIIPRGRPPGGAHEVNFRYEWEDETQRIRVLPLSEERLEELSPAPVGVYFPESMYIP